MKYLQRIKYLFENKDIKEFRERYSELEIKEFCHKFFTGRFDRSKWKYEGTGIAETDLERLIQKLIDDEIIIPIDSTKRRYETEYKIKSSDKEKILRRINYEISKKEEEEEEDKKVQRINREMEILKSKRELDELFTKN
jgi:hypothetical protein